MAMATINIGVALIRSDILADDSHVQYQKIMDGTVGSEIVAGVTTYGLKVDRSIKSLSAKAPNQVLVGLASADAVNLNANRKGLNLKNVSNYRICLGFGANAAVLGSGIVLEPGQGWSMGEYDFTTAKVTAIAAGSDAPLAIQEWE